VIGVIFFGLLGTQAAPAASAVAPQLRTGLVAAGVPAGYTSRIQAQFGVCLHDRLVASDPTVTPPSCRTSAVGGAGAAALPPAAHEVLASAGGAAVRHDFVASLQRTLWFQAGVFLLSFLLMLALPAGAGRRRGGDSAPAGQTPTSIPNAPSGSTVATMTEGGAA
jgi:hypothetical protein